MRRGAERTSPISVRSAALAVVGDGWLPVVVTRMTVDPDDRKFERLATQLDDVLPTSSSEFRTVVIEISGVSSLTIPQLRTRAGVASLGRLFGHRARVGGGCGNVG